jgi:bifunctional non-homologous end joining protein LigD
MATRRKTATKKTSARTKIAAKSPKPPVRKASAKKATAKKTAAKKSAPARAPARKTAPKLTAAEQLREYQRKRDFEKTAEPSGAATRKRESSRSPSASKLRFVIQKHDASHLHYDLRLEMDGVMKSWAVPKGPSADPAVKRLAMQVEDHPIDYNTFEGTIPAGEYGGGTVMLWDNGTYEIENPLDDDMNTAAHDQYERGEMKVIFHGKRIKGSYAIVRTKGMGGSSAKPSWLLIKHRDDKAKPESDSSLTEKYTKSVETNRTMDQISEGTRVWHSSR